MHKDGVSLLMFPGCVFLDSSSVGNLKPDLQAKAQTKEIGLFHRKTGIVFQCAVFSVLWAGA